MSRRIGFLAIAALLPGLLGAVPAQALNNEDLAGMMGMLWRFQTPVCPSISFDPKIFVKAVKLPGGTPEAVRARFGDAFDRGNAVVDEWMHDGANAAACKAVETYFDGKHDFFGNVSQTRQRSVPGLTIRE